MSSVAVDMKRCSECGAVYLPTAPHQRFCADRCRWRASDRARWQDPAYVAISRERFRARRLSVVPESQRQPWLDGEPPHGTHLVGAAYAITITPRPARAIELRHTRHLHGAVSHMLGVDHDRTSASFSLIPRDSGWGAWFTDVDLADRAAASVFACTLFGKPAALALSMRTTFRAPSITRRGRRRLRIDAVSPVVFTRDAHRTAVTSPKADTLTQSLKGLALRLGYDPPPSLCAEIVSSETVPTRTDVGGHFFGGAGRGIVIGWTGHVVVECNAPMHWLLAASGCVGLGGKTALGFGRVRVSPCD